MARFVCSSERQNLVFSEPCKIMLIFLKNSESLVELCTELYFYNPLVLMNLLQVDLDMTWRHGREIYLQFF